MNDFSHTMHVDVPPEQVFAMVVDPAFQQGRFMRIEVVTDTAEGVGATLRYYYEVMGRRFGSGTCTYTEFVPGERFTWEFAGGGAAMVLTGGPAASTWVFEPADGGTDVTIHSEFTTRIPVINHLARRIMMWAWKTRALPGFVAEMEKHAKETVTA